MNVSDNICRLCHFNDCDVRLNPCGCTLHARCLPISLVAEPSKDSEQKKVLKPIDSSSQTCPFCLESRPMSSIKLFPLNSTLLDRAVEIRKEKTNSSEANDNGKRKRSNSAIAEASYLLMSSSYSPLEDLSSGGNSLFTGGDFQRIGRWTDEELEFVDFLLLSFDQGNLTIPEGTRLNEFLCQILLCKGSRLTKKLKHAKLATRTYESKLLADVKESGGDLDYCMLATLQEKFLKSIANEASCLELRFNLTKTWRTLLTSLCVQIDSKMIDATAWLTSLEEMEHRAEVAEETIRKARRQRIGLSWIPEKSQKATNLAPPTALVSSHCRSNSSLSTLTCSAVDAGDSRQPTQGSPNGANTAKTSSCNAGLIIACSPEKKIDIKIDSFESSSEPLDDFEGIFKSLVGDTPDIDLIPKNACFASNNCGSFLLRIISYLETHNLPFEHVDVWVPSFSLSNASNHTNSPLLCHGGYATRSDIDPRIFNELREFGEQSTKVSFPLGRGIPGRVFGSGEPIWETNIDDANPESVERVKIMKQHGLKTALGIPFQAKLIDRLVVVMYGVVDRPHDPILVRHVTNAFGKYMPEPKWKLVVDLVSSEGKISCPQSGGFAHSHGRNTKSHAIMDSFATSTTSSQEREEELKIASLLGGAMPVLGDPTAPGSNEGIVNSYISLRLLLLRTPDRRSPEENINISVIRQSYRGYCQSATRSEREVALLLAKDWSFLVPTHIAGPSMSRASGNNVVPVPIASRTFSHHENDMRSEIPPSPAQRGGYDEIKEEDLQGHGDSSSSGSIMLGNKYNSFTIS